MTELTTKLIQRQTLSLGRINLNQRHCYDTAIQTQTNRLMQRLELPEKWMRRYTGGVLKPEAIAQRFNLRRVELAEWGQLADVKVLPGKLQSTAQSPPSVSPATSALNSTSIFTPVSPSVSPSISALNSSSPSASTSTSASLSTSPDREIPMSQISPRSFSSEESKIHSSSSSSTTLNTPPILPEATFRIRRGGSHFPAIASKSTLPSDGINHSSQGGACAHSMQDAGQQGIAPTRSMPEFKNASKPDRNSVATIESSSPVLSRSIRPDGNAPQSSSEALPLPSVKAVSQEDSMIAAPSTQTVEIASEGRLVSPVKGKLARSQRTTEPLLQIAVKARVERSQLTPEQPHALQPELIAVKPQLKLPLAPTASTSNQALPLVQKQIQSVSETSADELVAVVPMVTHQQQRIISKPPTTPVEVINIDKVAAEVSRLLSRRLLLERERRGIRP
ncbi:MAG: hypothetical protein NW224_08560 [Leptolyngbyaceae cyanobacterium bins.302]|nr:hypothetical protein [Leptolyngbyaceae cyanobacterium bins.302]